VASLRWQTNDLTLADELARAGYCGLLDLLTSARVSRLLVLENHLECGTAPGKFRALRESSRNEISREICRAASYFLTDLYQLIGKIYCELFKINVSEELFPRRDE
jgi:hypothetical protein